MPLSNDLISQFVKATKEEKKKKEESTVYGVIVSCEPDGTIYARFDGSSEPTPVSTTTDVSKDERVIITIKNHTATVTGNLSIPSAKTTAVQSGLDDIRKDVADKIEEEILITAGTIVGNFVSTEQFEAEKARIDTLEAGSVTINESLAAKEASINKLTIRDAEITDRLNANDAVIETLKASNGEIKALIFGSATGDTIQTSFANSVVAQIGDAQIKSAMIDSIAASKITSGDILTNNVRVKSQNGLLLISNETIQISDTSRVRVQIGKDASNDYSINIWDADGKLMFSEGGITDSAIKEAIIRNDMVSDTANIAAHKLDIDSLFDEINDSTKTIKSTRVYLDENKQTLDVAFKTLTTEVSDLGESVSSQGTAISAIQGQISTKIWQQDINSAKNEMSTKYTSLEQSLSKFETTVGSTYATKNDLKAVIIGGKNLLKHSAKLSSVGVGGKWKVVEQDDGYNILSIDTTDTTWEECQIPLYTAYNELKGAITVSFEFKQSANNLLSFNLGAYSDTSRLKEISNFDVSTNCTITTLTDEWSRAYYTFNVDSLNGLNNATSYKLQFKKLSGYSGSIKVRKPKLESGNKPTDWSPAPEDIELKIANAETKITQTADSVNAVATKADNNGAAIAALELAADGLTATVNATKKQKPHEADGTSGTTGYVGFCTISVTGNYVNVPVTFSISNRGQQSSNVSFCLNSLNGTDPTLSHIQSDGGIKVWAYKPKASTWILIAQKSEGYDVLYVNDYSCPRAGLSLSWSDIHYDSLPTSNITEATRLAGKLTKATVDNAGKTATNYLNFSTSGLVVGDHTASSLGNNVLIDSSAVKVRTGTTVNSVFGANLIELAKNNSDATISMLNGAFKIYYSSDNSDGGFGIYGKTSSGQERLAFQAVNENDNLTLGWGGYAAKANSTNIYGHKIYLTTNDDIVLNPGSGNIQTDGNLVLTNGKNLFGKNTSGAMRSMAILNASNQMVFGYGSYENSEGNTFYEGNIVSIISRSDVSITPGSGNVKIDGNVALTNGKNLFGTNTSGTMRSMAVLNASNQMLFGYGSYSNSEGSVYYDGNNVTMRSKNDITFQTPNEKVALEDNSGGATYSAFFRPESNGKCTLGLAAKRWYAVYATNSTVQTSDAREKENISSLGDIHSELFDRLNPVQYNFINGNGKICYGLLSQEVIESMEELGIGEHDLDLVHHDFFTDDNGEEQDTFGITYTNLIAMLIHEVQKLKTEIKHLKIT